MPHRKPQRAAAAGPWIFLVHRMTVQETKVPSVFSLDYAQKGNGILAFSGSQIAVLTALMVLVASIPIWTNPLPPLSDYVNHLARMQVIAKIAQDSNLARFYEIDWQPVPNLMMDLIVPPLARLVNIYHAGQIFLI